MITREEIIEYINKLNYNNQGGFNKITKKGFIEYFGSGYKHVLDDMEDDEAISFFSKKGGDITYIVIEDHKSQSYNG